MGFCFFSGGWDLESRLLFFFGGKDLWSGILFIYGLAGSV